MRERCAYRRLGEVMREYAGGRRPKAWVPLIPFTHWTISQETMSTPYVRKARWRIFQLDLSR